jgi:hypothetical protein
MIATFYNSHKNYNNFTKMNKKLDDNHIEYKFNIIEVNDKGVKFLYYFPGQELSDIFEYITYKNE